MKSRALLLLIASALSFNAFAASPFMVSQTAAESTGGSVVQNSAGKPTTLAESLVQLRQCNAAHMSNRVSETPIPVQSATSTEAGVR